MAARPLLLGLASAARSGALSLPIRAAPKRAFQLSTAKLRPTAATSSPSGSTPLNSQTPPPGTVPPQAEVFADNTHAAFLGEADSNEGHDAVREAHGAPPPPLEADNSAFLGEADSDDHFEVRKTIEGDNTPPLEANNAAFLGEADSDDGFEARRAAEGDKRESLDAKNAAFLGEADSDDAHEADFDINPDKHRHKIEDTSVSGLHGQQGEQDQ
ncbi:uncharacterized protein Z520_11901 [Fonsecaea multimorphosa CBS 102226]|uniref:Uncharacterized protein n=1 Tax=Fonsecaea multimorphosa CBS 102226 TaxID=1442371 RepID=A0A0D2I5B9_9EURO|nr:uncharacterized protein Z520_11901 [Fonsecaea multimorphosa CBS 102226]KIX92426.1 hypothetical protein Z520_11901 [Fonsecaea multimorphosa CBS 102226]OAL17796.1 hypothetical protein AYO22_11324 [Fonsecaea multimorphosa]